MFIMFVFAHIYVILFNNKYPKRGVTLFSFLLHTVRNLLCKTMKWKPHFYLYLNALVLKMLLKAANLKSRIHNVKI